MKAERKTDTTGWMLTSDDYILRSARAANITVGGTLEAPIFAADTGVTDTDILTYIELNSDANDDTKGIQINAVLVRIIPQDQLPA